METQKIKEMLIGMILIDKHNQCSIIKNEIEGNTEINLYLIVNRFIKEKIPYRIEFFDNDVWKITV